MKISAAIATLAITGRTPGEVDLVDRISQFITESPHAFLGSGAFLALGRRLAAAGVKPVDGEQVDITPFARSITVAEAKEALQRAATRSTFERVVSVVAVQGEIRPDRITPETVLTQIGFDSLGLVELVLALEEHFEVSIPEDMKELETVKTVEDIAHVVEKVLLSSKLSAAGLHPQCVDFATGTYEDARKTLSLPTAGAYMVMTTGPATVSGNVEKPSAAEHTQLGLPHVDAGPVADATVEAAPDEHQILADAAGRFLEAICPDFSGYMPRALNRLAQAIEEGRVHVIPNDETDRDQLTYYILEQG